MNKNNNNNYVRPEVTKNDIITNSPELLHKNLKHYVEIHPDNYIDIDTGIWIRYITNEGKYRSGGILKVNKAPEYFILKNPYCDFNWSITLDKNIIFMKNINNEKDRMIQKNNLYRLYEAGLVKILDEPEN